MTQLSQGLSDENDALIGLVRNTLATLRSLQGLPVELPAANEDYGGQPPSDTATGIINAPPSYEELSAGTDEVLEHLRGLLTNPSFVPLEEVEVREDEIIRLREGWEKMASRWKEAVTMMDGWRKRMVDTGDTINLDDLTRGMTLGAEIPAVPESRNDRSPNTIAESYTNRSSGSIDRPKDASESPDVLPPDDKEIEALAADASFESESHILQARSPNARPGPSPRKVSFLTIPDGEAKAYDYEDASLLDFSGGNAIFSPIKRKQEKSAEVSSPILRGCKSAFRSES